MEGTPTLGNRPMFEHAAGTPSMASCARGAFLYEPCSTWSYRLFVRSGRLGNLRTRLRVPVLPATRYLPGSSAMLQLAMVSYCRRDLVGGSWSIRLGYAIVLLPLMIHRNTS
eukprot:scaffold593_cov382-Prasinococcus_capsulatus_cf.AAC.19